jgi:purine-binding chemotaxis protein CheW
MEQTAAQEAAGDQREIVSFRVAGQDFCIDICCVREIRGWSPTTVLPHAPDYVVGLMNLRGNVIPVIDLSLRLGLGRTEPSQRHVIVITNDGRGTVGLLVDSVSDIMSMPCDELKQPPDVATSHAPAFLEGVFTVDEKLIRVLDLAKAVPSNRAVEE